MDSDARKEMLMKKHYHGLNIIRGICAIFIVLYHYTARYNEIPLIPENLKTSWAITFPWGCLAVVTFFLLSGFLCNIERAGDETAEKPLQYLCKRFIRLYPAFLIAVCLTSVVTLIFYKEAFVGIKDILFNLTMLPGLLKAQPVDGVYWTLQYEIIFYFVIAALLFLNKPQWNKYIFNGWLAGSIVFYWLGGETGGNVIFSAIRIFLMPDYIQTFFLGIALKQICEDKQDYWTYAMILLSFVNHYFWQGLNSTIWLAVFALLILYITKFNSSTILNKESKVAKFFGWLSGISYALYLVHQNIGYAIMQGLMSMGATHEIFVLIPIAVSVLLAWAIHQFIEKPIIKWSKKGEKDGR